MKNSFIRYLAGDNDNLFKSWIRLDNSVYSDSTLSLELLDQIFFTIVNGNKFQFSIVNGKKAFKTKTKKREHLATAFAELFVLDERSIYPDHFKILEEEFSKSEIIEIFLFVSFNTSLHVSGRILELTNKVQQSNHYCMENIKRT